MIYKFDFSTGFLKSRNLLLQELSPLNLSEELQKQVDVEEYGKRLIGSGKLPFLLSRRCSVHAERLPTSFLALIVVVTSQVYFAGTSLHCKLHLLLQHHLGNEKKSVTSLISRLLVKTLQGRKQKMRHIVSSNGLLSNYKVAHTIFSRRGK